MKAVITVAGRDTVGILAKVTGVCAECGVNVIDVSQTVMQDIFVMTMMSDISKCPLPFDEFADRFEPLRTAMNLQIHVMHEDIFNSMHRI
ncbi:UPF0237 protein [Clostridia bacterium]|nr:UPF0237 protein [Clostridia bacterium]